MLNKKDLVHELSDDNFDGLYWCKKYVILMFFQIFVEIEVYLHNSKH